MDPINQTIIYDTTLRTDVDNIVAKTEAVNPETLTRTERSSLVSTFDELKEKVNTQMCNVSKQLEELVSLRNKLEKTAWKYESNFILINTTHGRSRWRSKFNNNRTIS
jgi:hypothetical protein